MTVDMIINPIDREFKDVQNKIHKDKRYWSYFKDCIRAIDGTHVLISISPTKQIPYIGRKDITKQNIMDVCDFHMRLTFVLGWMGRYST